MSGTISIPNPVVYIERNAFVIMYLLFCSPQLQSQNYL